MCIINLHGYVQGCLDQGIVIARIRIIRIHIATLVYINLPYLVQLLFCHLVIVIRCCQISNVFSLNCETRDLDTLGGIVDHSLNHICHSYDIKHRFCCFIFIKYITVPIQPTHLRSIVLACILIICSQIVCIQKNPFCIRRIIFTICCPVTKQLCICLWIPCTVFLCSDYICHRDIYPLVNNRPVFTSILNLGILFNLLIRYQINGFVRPISGIVRLNCVDCNLANCKCIGCSICVCQICHCTTHT